MQGRANAVRAWGQSPRCAAGARNTRTANTKFTRETQARKLNLIVQKSGAIFAQPPNPPQGRQDPPPCGGGAPYNAVSPTAEDVDGGLHTVKGRFTKRAERLQLGYSFESCIDFSRVTCYHIEWVCLLFTRIIIIIHRREELRQEWIRI